MHDATTAKFFTRRSLIKLAGFAMAVPMAGCSDNKHSWNQNLIVTVQTPDGEKSGNAVVQATTAHAYLLGAGESYLVRIKGEATVVDLGNGKYLFALLEENKTEYLANHVFSRAGKLKAGDNVWAQLSSSEMSGALAPVDPELYPLLVTFGDINDPKSVKEVKPSDLAASFGPGYALKSVTLEITNEPVTEGVVERLLPWLFTLHTRLIPTDKKYAKDYLPIENVGPEYFLFPFRKVDK